MRLLQIGNDTWIDADKFIGAECDKVGAGTVVIYLIGKEYGVVVNEKDWRDSLYNLEGRKSIRELRHER